MAHNDLLTLESILHTDFKYSTTGGLKHKIERGLNDFKQMFGIDLLPIQTLTSQICDQMSRFVVADLPQGYHSMKQLTLSGSLLVKYYITYGATVNYNIPMKKQKSCQLLFKGQEITIDQIRSLHVKYWNQLKTIIEPVQISIQPPQHQINPQIFIQPPQHQVNSQSSIQLPPQHQINPQIFIQPPQHQVNSQSSIQLPQHQINPQSFVQLQTNHSQIRQVKFPKLSDVRHYCVNLENQLETAKNIIQEQKDTIKKLKGVITHKKKLLIEKDRIIENLTNQLNSH